MCGLLHRKQGNKPDTFYLQQWRGVARPWMREHVPVTWNAGTLTPTAAHVVSSTTQDVGATGTTSSHTQSASSSVMVGASLTIKLVGLKQK